MDDVLPARLEVRALCKTFGPARVLDGVDMVIRPGEVHGLAGQNGSGKSTFIKILTGIHPPDPGAEYHIDGRPVRLPVRWTQVHEAGVSVVHQDLGLLDQLSVADNICVGGFPTSLGRINRVERDRLAGRTLARLGVDIDPHRPVEGLEAAERAEVAIARAMRDHTAGTGLVILDESTRALTGTDLQRVHTLLRRISATGSSVLIISHNLAELVKVTNRVTVLRDGVPSAAGVPTAQLGEEGIARLMLGAALDEFAALRSPAAAAPMRPHTVTVRDVRGAGISGIDLSMASGEVVGITGLPGNGYERIPYLLTGALVAEHGELRVKDTVIDLARAGVRQCLRAGVVLVPERRDRDGLALELSMRDNISLPRLRERGHTLFVGRAWQRRAADHAARILDIRPRQSALLVKELSGGNQQKVLLAKWLGAGPRLLVLHEPTQAVDVGARQDILRAVRRAADAGAAVLLVSSEPDDLVAACDRVLRYADGALLGASHASADDLIAQTYAEPGARSTAGAGAGAVDPASSTGEIVMTLFDKSDEAAGPGGAPGAARDVDVLATTPGDSATRTAVGHPATPDTGPVGRPVRAEDRPAGLALGTKLRSLSSQYALVGVWLVMAAAFTIMMPHKFLGASTAQAVFGSQSPLLFLALASLCMFVVGEFDLSFASVMGLSATIVPVLSSLHGFNIALSCLIALAASAACGLLNALFVVTLKVSSLIVTLGSASLFLGIAELISSSTNVAVSDKTFSAIAVHSVAGLPLSFYYGLIVCAAFAYVLAWTPIGRHVVFVGANRDVARLAGINVDRIRAGGYLIAALMSGAAGVLLVMTVGGFDPTGSSAYLLPALAAVFLGTATVTPGRFNPMGTFIGIYFLETGILGLQLLGYTGWVQDAFYGAGLVVAVTVATVVRARSRA